MLKVCRFWFWQCLFDLHAWRYVSWWMWCNYKSSGFQTSSTETHKNALRFHIHIFKFVRFSVFSPNRRAKCSAQSYFSDDLEKNAPFFRSSLGKTIMQYSNIFYIFRCFLSFFVSLFSVVVIDLFIIIFCFLRA